RRASRGATSPRERKRTAALSGTAPSSVMPEAPAAARPDRAWWWGDALLAAGLALWLAQMAITSLLLRGRHLSPPFWLYFPIYFRTIALALVAAVVCRIAGRLVFTKQ